MFELLQWPADTTGAVDAVPVEGREVVTEAATAGGGTSRPEEGDRMEGATAVASSAGRINTDSAYAPSWQNAGEQPAKRG